MAPRKQTHAPLATLPSQTLIVDNGAYTIKAGIVTANSAPDPTASTPLPRLIPNCLARDRYKKVYIGAELSRCKDFGEITYRRPVEKGHLVNWEAERVIWERCLLAGNANEDTDETYAPLGCDPTETSLLLTEAPNNLPVLQTNCDQIVFEEFGFASYARCLGPPLNAFNDIQATFRTTPLLPSRPPPAEIVMIIDAGYSHTTITPVLNGRALQSGIRRLDVGGKLLTNYLTRLLSLRYFDMRNDTHIVNEIREACCYVSEDFKSDLEATWKGTQGEDRLRTPSGQRGREIAQEYVLPDYHTRMTGQTRAWDAFAKGSQGTGSSTDPAFFPASAAAPPPPPPPPHESDGDTLRLVNERFSVPELLFTPTDIGLGQSGLARQLMSSLASLPLGLWPGLLANVVVVGGLARTDGLIRRLQREITALAPAECVVRVARPADPVASTWHGARALVVGNGNSGGGGGDGGAAGLDGSTTSLWHNTVVSKAEYEEFGPTWTARRFERGIGGGGAGY